MTKLSSNLIEAANRAEATALLIRLGYKVYRPEADVGGEDLILRKPDDQLVAVQLKGRMTVDFVRYGERDIWMLFPSRPWKEDLARDWFLVPHDSLYAELRSRHGHTKSFENQAWSSSSPAKWLEDWLDRYKLDR